MIEQHPITPPLELIKHWEEQHFDEGENYDVMLIQAYQTGADHELEACCEWLLKGGKSFDSSELRAARRSKTPTKEEALDELCLNFDRGRLKEESFDIIRRALEALPDD